MKTPIMDVEVEKIPKGFRIKFVALIGEIGPELIMPDSLALTLFEKLRESISG